ncbi:MAG TPA: RNA polymerase sigma factor [Ktedonobacterales bacterium]
MNRAGLAPRAERMDEVPMRRERMYKPMETEPLTGSTPAEVPDDGEETTEPVAQNEEHRGEAAAVTGGAAFPGEFAPCEQASPTPTAGTDTEAQVSAARATNGSESAETRFPQAALPEGTPLDFEALFQTYFRPLSSFLYRMVGDYQLAQDLTQDCFVKLHLAMKAGQPLANVRAWLYRVATNAALDERRRHKRIAWLPLLAGGERPEPEYQDPEDQVALRDRLQQVLAGISSNLSVCLLLHLHHGFSHDEIATILGISSGAARTRLQRAREAFKTRWLAMEGRDNLSRSEAAARPDQRQPHRVAPARSRGAAHTEDYNGGSIHELYDT